MRTTLIINGGVVLIYKGINQSIIAYIAFRTNPIDPTNVSTGLSTNVPKATRLSTDALAMAATAENKQIMDT